MIMIMRGMCIFGMGKRGSYGCLRYHMVRKTCHLSRKLLGRHLVNGVYKEKEIQSDFFSVCCECIISSLDVLWLCLKRSHAHLRGRLVSLQLSCKSEGLVERVHGVLLFNASQEREFRYRSTA